jgi:hypothetical protein
MSQALTLQIPEAVYKPLLEIAKRRGQSPEEFSLQCLMASIHQFADDPLESFIGSIQSDIPDWSENHDRYLGDNLLLAEDSK